MKWPPTEKARRRNRAPSNIKELTDYRRARAFQDLLARRLNRVASVAELMPRVLAVTFARGTRYRANADHKRIAQRAATAKP
jgi:hypothetical protein